MKRVLVLVLLQICFCFQLNMNLNDEIMKHLSEFKLNSSPAMQNVPIPGRYMNNHPSSCVSTFSRELKNILNNITHSFTMADPKHKIQLQNLQANLRELGKNLVDDDKCIMTQLDPRGKNSTWIKKYIYFLKKLNSSG